MAVKIRAYVQADRPAVRTIFGMDEFARPRLLKRFPRMAEYVADDLCTYYTDYEPESLIVAEEAGEILGALMGAVDTARQEGIYFQHIRPLVVRRCLLGAYGFPIWLVPVIRTERAARHSTAVPIDPAQFPAHLHIGVLPAARRKGLGTALMQAYTTYLREHGIAGFHLCASSYHTLAVTFYRKLGLDLLGQSDWYLHTGYKWLKITESIFARRV